MTTGQPVHRKVSTGNEETTPVRELDPNVQQRKASRPEDSVWVMASAGTGKTKVLTDRVLRLLLPRESGEPGTPPLRILCLTFTKAGAGEMALRLSKTLARWAVMAPEELREQLRTLLARDPVKTDMAAARRLFTEVSDAPGGLKIMTIHSFCQSVLGRFPLEAGVPPHFTPLEDGDARTLLQLARDRVITRPGPLAQALERIARTVNEEQFFDLVSSIAREREQLDRILSKFGDVEGIYQHLCETLGLPPGRSADDMLQDACHMASFDEPGLRTACQALTDHGTDSDKKNALKLQDWLDIEEDRLRTFKDYSLIYLTKENSIRAKLAGVNVDRNRPGINAILQAEAERLLKFLDQLNAAVSAELTRDVLLLGKSIVDEYQELKRERASLDYDDLIFTTCRLLEGRAENLRGNNAAAWVLYKLDQGIDHILIDEAQDTNPEQWRIVEAITNEFTAGLGASDTERTLFVVGDGKQSIYSFQRASRELFDSMHKTLGRKLVEAGKELKNVDLDISFRSAKSVLQTVDAVFNGPLREGVSETPVRHESYRRGQAGRVELWPLCETPPIPETDPWSPPTQINENPDGAARLAQKIAAEIESWIGREDLPSKGRKIKPGDIMILLRTRSAFFSQVAKALKDRKIPVSGTDRMILNDQIAVQDLLAFARFALQPLDSLTQACILKSPLIGMSEEDLFQLAYNRAEGTALWNALMASGHTDIKNYLNQVTTDARLLRPFDFFSGLLQKECPADSRSGLRAMQKRLGPDCTDPIDELLNAALDFESSHTPSLQHFIQWQAHEDTEIKREMEEAGDFVRIMTVHGAKGLQAPIVILPDTVRAQRGANARADRRLLWPDKTGLQIPVWSPRSDMDFTIYKQAAATIDRRTDEEYRRLLYVAMTRAEDRLYLAGYTGKKKTGLESWYDFFHPALSSLPGIETLEDGTLRFDNPQTKDPSRDETQKETQKSETLPSFLLEPPIEERPTEALLRPSRAENPEPAVYSPLKRENISRFRRGNLTHKLLEFLPGHKREIREKSAADFLAHYAPDVSGDIRNSIVAETLMVLDSPEFAPVFGPGSLAEVPVTGRLQDGRVISGQIDRLLVTDNEVMIVDYKTNRPPPVEDRDVPKIYRDQMAAYADAIRKIYPGKTVSCALLWTDGARLMKLKV